MIEKIEVNNYIRRLIKKIENAPDFGYDDEEVELSEICKEKCLYWCWNDSLFKPEILITNKMEDIEEMAELKR